MYVQPMTRMEQSYNRVQSRFWCPANLTSNLTQFTNRQKTFYNTVPLHGATLFAEDRKRDKASPPRALLGRYSEPLARRTSTTFKRLYV
ncbi:hypothetical protein E2C01_019285 [Portunus trituberculatus]|uniref:Uncharacterized protein n=1 Tax=Portunus trituberculatus TaxID=210409 RepID=A0A5B7DWU0_PORTR|nr:hypothetical protein [Portunus trituberculatus]